MKTRFSLLLGFVLAGWLSAFQGVHSANAGDIDTDKAMKSMAENIAKAMKSLRHESISIGQFTSPPQSVASGGAGLAKQLISHLENVGISVRRRAPVGFKGEYFADVDALGRPVARVEGKLVDERGRSLLSFTQHAEIPGQVVNSTESVASSMGLTFTSTPSDSGKKQAHKIYQSINEPSVFLRGNEVRASSSSPFAIAVHTGSGPTGRFQRQAPTNEDGMAFVHVGNGHYYAVELINDSPHDAAVTLTIDGLSVFSFSEFRDYKHFIVPAKTRSLIKGWHRTNNVSDSFEVTQYSKSAAAALLPKGGAIGTITAVFAAAWPADGSPPADERSARFRSRGTARGPEIKAEYKEVERHVGVVRSAISVRYEKE